MFNARKSVQKKYLYYLIYKNMFSSFKFKKYFSFSFIVFHFLYLRSIL